MRSINHVLVEGNAGHPEECVFYDEFFGTSFEEKPTTNLATGSSFTEIDTGKSFRFDELTKEWYPQKDAAQVIAKAIFNLN